MRYWAVVAAVLALFAPVFAHRIDVAPRSKQCFFENLQTDDRMTVSYEVGGASHNGPLEIDFYVQSPSGNQIYSSNRESQGSFSTAAASPGRYTYCFNNHGSPTSAKTVSFNVHGILFLGDDEPIAPVEVEIRELSNRIQMVKDEQAYLVVRERVHRNTCESTNSRVKWWGVAQIIILLSICGWNVHYLKSWFEVKRVL